MNKDKKIDRMLVGQIEKLISNGKIFRMDTTEIFSDLLNLFNELDDGKIGKITEIIARHLINPTSKRFGVTPQNTWYNDIKFFDKATNTYKKAECKTACGELQNINTSDFMFYCPTIQSNIKIEQQLFVIPTMEFLEIMQGYNIKSNLVYTGKQIVREKMSTSGNKVISFQSFYCETRLKASQKLAEFIWNCCYSYPTLKQYFNL